MSVEAFVRDPSTGAALYQCRRLRARLMTIQAPRYPADAVRVRDMLDVLAERVEQRLVALLVSRSCSTPEESA